MSRTYRLMGSVTRPHGVRGEVKVRPETDDPARFGELESVYLGEDEATLVRYTVTRVRFQPMGSGTAVILSLDGVTDREGAERLAGKPVLADEADLPPLADDEFYLGDLVGIAASGIDGERLGVVRDVLELPAQPVLVIERPDGSRVMVPFVDEFVEAVDPGEGLLVLRPVDGLLDPDGAEIAD